MLGPEQLKQVKGLYEKGEANCRNIAIIAHVDHGKTTLSDNLLATGGMMNHNLAGSQLVMDNTAMEQARGITINSSAISFCYKQKLVTLLDTPGHADFNAEVVKALRNVDGAILLVDVLEGLMTQTETVLGQAIKEGVKVILFLNKVDRMVNELYLDTAAILAALKKTISDVNNLITSKLENVSNYFKLGQNVAFGSALNNWATSISDLMAKKATFTGIKDKISAKDKTLAKDHPLAPLLLDMVIDQIPSPAKNQKYRLERLFGDELYAYKEQLDHCKAESPFIATITDVNYNKALGGHLSTVKVWAGSLKKKDVLYASNDEFDKPIQWNKVIIIMNKETVEVDCAMPGSIVAIQGLKNPQIGLTLSTVKNATPFPGLHYSRESNVMVSVRPEKLIDFTKLLEGLKILSEEDPTINFNLNETTKEVVLAGVGALHLEVTIDKLKEASGISIIASSPRVTYAESLESITPEVSVRSGNKHNDFNFYLMPLTAQMTKAIKTGELTVKSSLDKVMSYGISKELAKKIKHYFKNGSFYVDNARGALYMAETAENLETAIELALAKGPKIGAPLESVALILTFCKLHEDPRHRSLSQLINAFRDGVNEAMSKVETKVTEPGVCVVIDCPVANASDIMRILNSRQARLIETRESDLNRYTSLVFEMPLSRTFKTEKEMSLAQLLMSTTKGRAVWTISESASLKLDQLALKHLLQNNPNDNSNQQG